MSSKKEEIAVRETETETALDTVGDDSYLDQYAGVGFEETEAADLIIPRAMWTQMSPPRDARFKYGKGSDYEPGQIVDNVSGDVLAEAGESLTVILVRQEPAKRWHYQSYEEGGELLCESLDGGKRAKEPNGELPDGTHTDDCGQCVFAKWDDANGKPPVCKRHIRFVGILPDFDNRPMGFSFKSTSERPARLLVSTLAAYQSKPMFAHRLELRADSDENEHGQPYFMLGFKRQSGWASRSEVDAAVKLYKLLRDAPGVKISEEGDSDQSSDVPF